MQEDTDVEDGENEAQDSDDSEQIIAGGNPHFVLSWQNMFFCFSESPILCFTKYFADAPASPTPSDSSEALASEYCQSLQQVRNLEMIRDK